MQHRLSLTFVQELEYLVTNQLVQATTVSVLKKMLARAGLRKTLFSGQGIEQQLSLRGNLLTSQCQ